MASKVTTKFFAGKPMRIDGWLMGDVICTAFGEKTQPVNKGSNGNASFLICYTFTCKDSDHIKTRSC